MTHSLSSSSADQRPHEVNTEATESFGPAKGLCHRTHSPVTAL